MRIPMQRPLNQLDAFESRQPERRDLTQTCRTRPYRHWLHKRWILLPPRTHIAARSSRVGLAAMRASMRTFGSPPQEMARLASIDTTFSPACCARQPTRPPET